jgi:hypothetical protein
LHLQLLVPKGVDIYKRTEHHHDIFIISNTSHVVQTIALPTAMKMFLSGETIGSIDLPVYRHSKQDEPKSQGQ